MGKKKDPQHRSTNPNVIKELKRRNKKVGADRELERRKHAFRNGIYSAKGKIRKTEGFANLPESEQDRLVNEAVAAFEARVRSRGRHPDQFKPEEDEVYAWETLPSMKLEKSIDNIKEESGDEASVDNDSEDSLDAGSDMEEELVGAQVATLSQIKEAEAKDAKWTKRTEDSENTMLSTEFNLHRRAWRATVRVLNRKLHRLQKIKEPSELFGCLTETQQLEAKETFTSEQLQNMTPLQFFTPPEISFLQNRFACGNLDVLPGPPGWWDMHNDEKDQVLGTLPDPELALEAYELMFLEDTQFFWRISWLDTGEKLVMTEKKVVTANGGDPRQVVVNLDAIKQEDIDEEQLDESEESTEYEALDDVIETSGKSEPEDFDYLGGFIVDDD